MLLTYCNTYLWFCDKMYWKGLQKQSFCYQLSNGRIVFLLLKFIRIAHQQAVASSQLLGYEVFRLWGYEVRFAQICRYSYIYYLKTYKRSDLKTSKLNELEFAKVEFCINDDWKKSPHPPNRGCGDGECYLSIGRIENTWLCGTNGFVNDTVSYKV